MATRTNVSHSVHGCETELNWTELDKHFKNDVLISGEINLLKAQPAIPDDLWFPMMMILIKKFYVSFLTIFGRRFATDFLKNWILTSSH